MLLVVEEKAEHIGEYPICYLDITLVSVSSFLYRKQLLYLAQWLKFLLLNLKPTKPQTGKVILFVTSPGCVGFVAE